MAFPVLPNGDLVFPKATINQALVKLQAEVTEFVTSVILSHERYFYHVCTTHFPDIRDDILTKTTKTIIQFIVDATNTFYNQIYADMQDAHHTTLVKSVEEMSQYAEYKPHVLLDKLIRLTIDVHIDVVREQLATNTVDLYLQTVLNQINTHLLSCNLLHVLSKGPTDDDPFVAIPPEQKAFDIVIDKNI